MNTQWNRSKTHLLLPLSAGIVVVLGLGVIGGARTRDQDQPAQTKTDAERIKGLEDELTALAKRYEKLSHDVNNLANFSPPIGSVIAYSGKWPDKGPGCDAFETKMGWMLCDGR